MRCPGKMTINKGFLNIILLGFGFMFVFTAFQTMGNIQKTILESMNTDDPSFTGDGYISLCIVYAVFAVLNWAAPSLLAVTGPRVAMLLGAVTYVLFIASFLGARAWLLYAASALIGAGAAFLWTGQGCYLTQNSNEQRIGKDSGVFWAMLQASMFFGNLFVFFQFQGMTHIDADTRTLVFWVLTGVSIVGIAFLLVLRPAPRDDDRPQPPVPTPTQALVNAGKLFVTRDMMLLSVTFFYTGIELSFYSGVYGSAISFTEQLGDTAKQLIGLNGIFIGLGEVIGGALFGILGSKTIRWGRSPIVIVGFVLHIIAFFLIFLNLPDEASMHKTNTEAFITTSGALAITCSFLLGFADSCYNTQIYSTLGGVFKDDSSSAFAIFKFIQSVAAAICFFYATYIGLYIHLGILVVLATAGTASFCLVEYFGKSEIKTIPDTADSELSS